MKNPATTAVTSPLSGVVPEALARAIAKGMATRATLSNVEIDEVYRANIRRLQERGTWTKPAYPHPGSRYQPSGDDGATWEEIKQRLWGPWLEK